MGAGVQDRAESTPHISPPCGGHLINLSSISPVQGRRVRRERRVR